MIRVRDHWPLVAVLALAAILRLGVAIAYHPALFYSDSWGYVLTARFHSAWGIFVPGFETVRPSGYPLLLDVIALVDRSASAITAVQHVVGLAVGVIVFGLVRRCGAPVWLSTCATAVVVLDGYAIALEQHVLSETFFALALLGSAAVVAGRRWGARAVVVSGVLLALAVTLRTAAAFAVPAWVLFVVLTRPDWRRPALGVCALLVPLLIYAGAHAASGRGFGMTEATGWFLYGRTGELADCRQMRLAQNERRLCAATAATPERDRNPLHFIWSPRSPAQREFGDAVNLGSEAAQRSDGVLRAFALKVVRARPGAYLRVVAEDFFRYFVPGRMSPYGPEDDHPITLPKGPNVRYFDARRARRYFDLDSEPRVGSPSGALRGYADWIHTPRWLLALLMLATLLSVGLAAARRRRLSSNAATALLLVGGSASILLGSTATAGFNVRYLVPLVPSIIAGGVAALVDIKPALRKEEVEEGKGAGAAAT